MVVCFYFEWFGSQACLQRVFLTPINPCRLELRNGVFSLQRTPDDQRAVLESDFGSGLFWVPCSPAPLLVLLRRPQWH